MDVRHEAEFTALRRILDLSRGTSSFTTAVCNSPAFRETLFVELRDEGISFTHAAVVAGSLDPVEEVRVQIPSGATDAVFITGLDYLLAESSADSDRLLAVLNRSRERWRSAFPKQPLVFWLTTHTSVRLTTHAPDLRAWVSHELEFEDATVSGIRPDQPSLSRNFTWLSNLDAAAKRARLADLDQRLSLNPPEPALFQEWARAWEEKILLMTLLGEYQHAEQSARELLGVLDDADDSHQYWKAEITDLLAGILIWNRRFVEARSLLQTISIPTYSKFADQRSVAITSGKIARIEFAEGNFDRAEAIVRQDVLPRLKDEKDLREYALAWSLVSDVMVARGQLDPGQEVIEREVLPPLLALGDQAAMAVALSRAAHILRRRREYAAALDMHRNQVLPVFVRTGNMESQAASLAEIADILLAQGQTDEAIRILRDEELPIHERLAVPHRTTVCRAHLALALRRRGREQDTREAFRLLTDCHQTAHGRGWPEARQFEAILLNWGVPKEWLKAP
jgi:tetratricopeptide (TPR) repeat protein